MSSAKQDAPEPLLPEGSIKKRLSGRVKTVALIVVFGAPWMLLADHWLPGRSGALRYLLYYARFMAAWIIIGSFIQQLGLPAVAPRARVLLSQSLRPARATFLFHLGLAVLWLVPAVGVWFYLEPALLDLLVTIFAGYFVLLETWRAYQALGRRSHRLDALALDEARDIVPEVVHFTDLHLTEHDDGEMIDRHTGKMGGNQVLGELLRAHGDGVLRQAGAILVTGDATDAGTEAQWQAFFRLMGEAGLLDKLVLVPGNHELNIASGTSAGWGSVHWDGFLNHEVRTERALRCLLAIDRAQGGRARVLNRPPRSSWKTLGAPRPEPELVSLSQYLAAELREIDALRPGWPPYERWRDVDLNHFEELAAAVVARAYPMLVDVPDSDLTVLVLDSNVISANTATNAFGELSEEQLGRLSTLLGVLERGPRRPTIVAMHHHMGDGHGAFQRVMGIVDADGLLQALQRLGSTVLLNGHRHIGYLGQVKDAKTGAVLLQVVAGRSTTLGDEDESKPAEERLPGFRVIELDKDTPGTVRLRKVQSVSLTR
jgi:Calcineurin-like phosphoesterase